MVEEERYCIDIVTQIAAVRAALRRVEEEVLKDHVGHCVEHEVRRAGEFEVVGALTTVTETFERVSIHGVRQEILRAQCEAAGLPQRIVPIPYPCPNEIYEARMGEAVASAVRDGVTHMRCAPATSSSTSRVPCWRCTPAMSRPVGNRSIACAGRCRTTR